MADAGRSPARRIRVVFSVDNMRTGGTELNAVRTAELIDRDRFDLSVVLLNDADGPLLARYERAGIPVERFPIDNLYGPASVRTGLRLARHLRRTGADVVHSHDVYSGIFTTTYARLAGVRGVISSRRFFRFPTERAALLARASRVTYRLSHRVLTNSATVGRRLWEAEGVARERVVVVPNFVDDGFFEPMSPAAREAARAALGLPPGAPTIGIVARLVPVKDHATLMQAFARLRDRSTQLVLVGEGPLDGELRRLAATLGIDGRVHFAGLRPHAPNLHHLFDVSVLSSTSEGFPNSIVEAMAAGRAVVATDAGGSRDAVIDGETGRLVPIGDAAAMSEAIDALVADPERRAAMGRSGNARANAEYRASRVLPMLEGVYATLARRGAH